LATDENGIEKPHKPGHLRIVKKRKEQGVRALARWAIKGGEEEKDEKGVAKSRICYMLILTPCEGRRDFLKFPIPALFADQEEK
jgi:hypothetical protein